MPPTFRNLVFRGGGAVAYGYCGALAVLEERGLLPGIRRTAGASSGATTAALLAIGCSVAEITDFLLSIQNPKEPSVPVMLERLVKEYGVTTCDYVIDPLEKKIKEKTGSAATTLAQLAADGRFRQLYVMGSSLAQCASVAFSHETADLASTSISDAVRLSNSFPFASVAFKRGDVWWSDGGVTNNYPIQLFDSSRYLEAFDGTDRPIINPETLGAFSSWPATYGDIPSITSVVVMAKQLFTTLLLLQDKMLLREPADMKRTAYIDNPTFDFAKNWDMPLDEKRTIIQSGRTAMETFLS